MRYSFRVMTTPKMKLSQMMTWANPVWRKWIQCTPPSTKTGTEN